MLQCFYLFRSEGCVNYNKDETCMYALEETIYVNNEVAKRLEKTLRYSPHFKEDSVSVGIPGVLTHVFLFR